MSSSTPVEDDAKSRKKLDALLQIETQVKEWWASEKAYEEDAPGPEDAKREKYLATFPYPYVNGKFHLGHAFTVSKAEFCVSYQKLKGRQTLFPFGMHCTGMPIKAAADKIAREIAEFGCPPNFPVEDRFRGYNWMADKEWMRIDQELRKQEKNQKRAKGKSVKDIEQELAKAREHRKRQYFNEHIDSALPIVPVSEEQEQTPPASTTTTKDDPTAFHSKKSKAAAKSGDMRQWFIMEQLDIPKDEIPKFANANYWLEYFPPLYKKDLSDIGLKVDWRRSFITTDVNPYYDSFVRWQFNTLNELGKLKFDKRFSIYSPTDGQPCADHDRASGEGVLPVEYTLIKMRVPDEVVAERFPTLVGKNVFLAPATLRPETMYGQTNCWVLPDGEYGAFEINDTDVFFITERAARNLSYQEHSKVPGQVSCLLQVTGHQLIGLPLIAPLALKYERVYVLPMLTVSTEKGTGVVTSVPSDSPDDYAALRDLQSKTTEWRIAHGVQDEWVVPFEPVEIIHVPSIGEKNESTNNAAKLMVEQLNIKSQKDRALLDIAKKEVYKQGFYMGTLLVGEHAGKPVQEAKPLVREQLLTQGLAIKYCEPEGPVYSRSGDLCVVALTDQWYLCYGQPTWKAQIERALEKLETYSDETRARFKYTIGWLEQWACSRSYGLGTNLPWDTQFLIESLSDSTIYMAYYTVSHILHNGEVDPRKLTPEALKANPDILIQPEQMTHQVWDYLFRSGPYPEDSTIPRELLERMRREFLHWYPVDIRVSGNDLINNHLTFFLYNHCAMFPEEHWPRSVRTNGYIMLDGEKMSKSKGNFMTLETAIQTYGRDATRLALADAGDGTDDANFTEETANAAILRIHTQLEWTREVMSQIDSFRNEPTYEIFGDLWFDNEINAIIHETNDHYEKTNFREALQTGFFAIQKARDTYRMLVGSAGFHKSLIRRFIEVQAIILSPICPHFCDYVWRTHLGYTSSVTSATWPTAPKLNTIIRKQGDCLFDNSHELVKAVTYHAKKSKKPLSRIVLYTARCYPSFNAQVIAILSELYTSQESKDFPEATVIYAALLKAFDEKTVKAKAMRFVMIIKETFATVGADAFNLEAPFDEYALFSRNVDFLQSTINITVPIEIVALNDDNSVPEGQKDLRKEKSTMPGRPVIIIE